MSNKVNLRTDKEMGLWNIVINGLSRKWNVDKKEDYIEFWTGVGRNEMEDTCGDSLLINLNITPDEARTLAQGLCIMANEIERDKEEL